MKLLQRRIAPWNAPDAGRTSMTRQPTRRQPAQPAQPASTRDERDVLPFIAPAKPARDTQARVWRPRGEAINPADAVGGSIPFAENAVERAERQMRNLRALMGMPVEGDGSSNGPRAA
jgi:hypothetical protein